MLVFSGSSANRPAAETLYLTEEDLIGMHRALAEELGPKTAVGGDVVSRYGLLNAVERPRASIFGRDAYSTIAEKAAAFTFALLQNQPFGSHNQRLALAAALTFCEINGKTLDSKKLDDSKLASLIRKAGGYRDKGIPAENVFSELRSTFATALG